MFEITILQKWAHKNWHMLNHFADSIREVGCVEYLHSEIFETVNRIFQRQDRDGSRKKKYVLELTLGRTIAASNLYSLKKLKLGGKARNLRHV